MFNNPLSFTDPTGYTSNSVDLTPQGVQFSPTKEQVDEITQTGQREAGLSQARIDGLNAVFAQNYAMDLMAGRVGTQIGKDTYKVMDNEGNFHKVKIDVKKALTAIGTGLSSYIEKSIASAQSDGPLDALNRLVEPLAAETGIASGVIAIRVALSSPLAKTAGQLGREGEIAVRSAFDIGDKIKFIINGRGRIADGINQAARTLNEVKNVAQQSFTQQLRDYLAYAQQMELKFNLYLRADTKVTAPLQDAIDAGLINRVDIPK